MRNLRYLLPLAAAVTALAAPAPAGASIVVQKGMLGVSMGMKISQVTARLGPPDAVSHPTNEIFGRFTRYRYGEVRVEFFDSDSSAFHFYTSGRSARTTNGVGVGTPESYLRSAIQGESCRNEGGLRSATSAGWRRGGSSPPSGCTTAA